jgi:hypothetical protein
MTLAVPLSCLLPQEITALGLLEELAALPALVLAI